MKKNEEEEINHIQTKKKERKKLMETD